MRLKRKDNNMSVKVTGRIERVFGTGNHWASLIIKGIDGHSYRAAGKIDSPVVGYDITVQGEKKTHPVYGDQIDVQSSTVRQASSEDGIVKYLSEFIKGIGPTLAGKLVREFGRDTLHVIEENPTRLICVRGITPEKAKKIHKSHMESKAFVDLTEFFGDKATAHQIEKVFEEFKRDGIQKIKENPYIIIYRVDGIGFIIADKLAQSSGIAKDDPRRIGAAIVHVLKTIAADGHCFCRLESLEQLLQKTCGSVPADTVGDVLVKEIQNGNLVLVDGDKVYWRNIYEAEQDCAIYLKELLEGPPVAKVTSAILEESVREFEIQNGFELVHQQRDAISASLRNRVSVITGGPGCGKTTIIQGIAAAWKKSTDSLFWERKLQKDVVLCAPTGKAARRISEVTGLKASTIHRLVFVGDMPENALVVVDEASMLDIQLAAMLLRKVRHNCQIVFVGDADQLSPIGPGSFFKDLIGSPCIPKTTLDVSHRNSGDIAKFAQLINHGMSPLAYEEIREDDSIFQYIPVNKETAQNTMIKMFLSMAQQFGIKDVLCVTPIRQKGKSHTASETLCEIIRERVNPLLPGAKTLSGCAFRENDRVMYWENNDEKEISNGDCGTVVQIDTDKKRIYVQFDNGKYIEMTVRETQDMTLAYAMSVHKAQGSEAKAVIISQCWEDYYRLNRALLYTAVTRAKEKVVLVGDDKAIHAAIRNVDQKIRNTRLKQLLSLRAA